MSSESTVEEATSRARRSNLLPWLWLGFSAAWAVVVFITDLAAWPLAVWIATTVGPLTVLKTRLDTNPDPRRSNP